MSRLIDADALADKVADLYTEGEDATEGDKVVNDVIDLIDNAPTVDIKPFALFSFDKDELNRIVEERVIEPIKNGELVVETEERPQGEWIVDQTPSYTGLYMISIDSLVTVANFDGKIFRSRNDVPLAIDAWMPLPEPYKEVENEEL